MSGQGENDNNNWKWGVFYYDPKNPKLFVPKRYGLGWTLNFGHAVSFVILGVLIAFLLYMILK